MATNLCLARIRFDQNRSHHGKCIKQLPVASLATAVGAWLQCCSPCCSSFSSSVTRRLRLSHSCSSSERDMLQPLTVAEHVSCTAGALPPISWVAGMVLLVDGGRSMCAGAGRYGPDGREGQTEGRCSGAKEWAGAYTPAAKAAGVEVSTAYISFSSLSFRASSHKDLSYQLTRQSVNKHTTTPGSHGNSDQTHTHASRFERVQLSTPWLPNLVIADG
jgi:hypothetical protein